jgi:hypothetical protein
MVEVKYFDETDQTNTVWSHRVRLKTLGLFRLDEQAPELFAWCTETYGEPALTGEHKNSKWYPCWNDIYFQSEEDLTLFMLRWA